MKTKINKELRAEPRLYGLSLKYFLVQLLILGLSAALAIGGGITVTKFIIVIVAFIISYPILLKLSNTSHNRKLSASTDNIKFYEDTLKAL